MRKKLKHWEIAGFLFSALMGVALHFLFNWSGRSSLLGAFSAVNESVWEHMKIFFVPIFIFTMIEFIVFAEPFFNFFAAKAASTLIGILTIPVLYYTLNGAFGKTADFVNIAIYYIAVLLAYLLSFHFLTSGYFRSGALQIAGFAFFWLLAFLFVYFTYRPAQLPLFFDPVTGLAGLPK